MPMNALHGSFALRLRGTGIPELRADGVQLQTGPEIAYAGSYMSFATALTTASATFCRVGGEVLLVVHSNPAAAAQLAPERAPRLLADVAADPARALRNLRGAWLLFFADEDAGRAVLATDRAARRSPCFAVHGERVLFGLGAHDVVAQDRTLARIRPQAIFDYLYAHVIVAPDTVYEHVQRLRPGEYVTIERGSVRRRLYWEPEYAEDGGPRDFRSAKQELVQLLEASVAQEVGPGKPGAFLSGGTDSSTIAGMLGRVTGQPANTYSIGFEAQGYDEMAYARIAARHFRTRHREYYVTPDDLVAAVPLVARSYDQPFGNSSALPAFLCAQMAKADGITRLLGGDGGDEIFGGNSRYAFQKVFDAYGRYAPPGADELVEAMLLRPQFVKRIPVVRRMRSYVEKAKLPVVTRMQVYNVLRQVGIERIFTAEFLQLVDPNAPAREEAAHYDSCTAASLVNRMLYFDWKYTLADNDLPKVVGTCDLAQIAVGFPFLDERLVEFANGLPPEWKVKRLRLRWFFKRALSDFLPREIIAKKKHGFGLPFGLWLVKHPGLQKLAFGAMESLGERGVVQRSFLGERAQGAAAGARGVLRRDRVDHDDARALVAGAPSRLCARAGPRGRVSVAWPGCSPTLSRTIVRDNGGCRPTRGFRPAAGDSGTRSGSR